MTVPSFGSFKAEAWDMHPFDRSLRLGDRALVPAFIVFRRWEYDKHTQRATSLVHLL